ncbi:unnamed protein product [Vitrella brassicaformis CCMP3155]|uniref:Uncharacterized protein n=1 Tax=Vitrella brassicaformis (strain CCMP3155) TaxID=1169540 RepID=A0A0G4GIN8_VITBC|nr:unnamed protein product [Vitrella brassicaformis CCMP3155]|eukprot:CEM29702.1 unnamed protein product [Vitrella brassicaformis CCMP3155]
MLSSILALLPLVPGIADTIKQPTGSSAFVSLLLGRNHSRRSHLRPALARSTVRQPLLAANGQWQPASRPGFRSGLPSSLWAQAYEPGGKIFAGLFKSR